MSKTKRVASRAGSKVERGKAAKQPKTWILCEAFCMTEDHTTVHGTLSPWAVACKDRKTCMRELRKAVKNRIRENYEGLDSEDDFIKEDMVAVLSHPEQVDKECLRYNYSVEDREVYWLVYSSKVVGT